MESIKEFLRWYKSKNVLPTCRPCIKRSSFTLRKVLTRTNLDLHHLNWPIFVCLVLQVQIFLPFTESDKDLLAQVDKNMVGDRQNCLHAKLQLTRLTSASPQIFGNRLLKQMLANFTITMSAYA